MRITWKFVGLGLAIVAMLVFAGVVVAEDMSNMPGMTHEHKATDKTESKTATITGEVVDTGCYAEEGAKGEKHASCAKMCIQGGIPAGILTSSGHLYIVLGENHKTPAEVVKGLEAKQVTATGKVIEKNGTHFIVVSKIAEAKASSSEKKVSEEKKDKEEKEKEE